MPTQKQAEYLASAIEKGASSATPLLPGQCHVLPLTTSCRQAWLLVRRSCISACWARGVVQPRCAYCTLCCACTSNLSPMSCAFLVQRACQRIGKLHQSSSGVHRSHVLIYMASGGRALAYQKKRGRCERGQGSVHAFKLCGSNEITRTLFSRFLWTCAPLCKKTGSQGQ
jgi:hypothetical protein